MFDGLKDYLFLRKISKKFRRPLRKMYSRKMTDYNLRIVKMIYKNLANRYGMSVKQVYNALPLTVVVDKEMENAYGLCESAVATKKGWFRRPRKMRKSTIYLNGKDVTTTTFVHEFGHYLRFLIAQIAMHRNKKAIEDFKNIVDIVRSRADAAMKGHEHYFTRGGFTVDEEENFAKSWEQYLKDGEAPDKKHRRLFPIFERIYLVICTRGAKGENMSSMRIWRLRLRRRGGSFLTC